MSSNPWQMHFVRPGLLDHGHEADAAKVLDRPLCTTTQESKQMLDGAWMTNGRNKTPTIGNLVQ